jgi:hypothetical protein
MNARCPACRREYTEEAVVWKPVAADEYAFFLVQWRVLIADVNIHSFVVVPNVFSNRNDEKKRNGKI